MSGKRPGKLMITSIASDVKFHLARVAYTVVCKIGVEVGKAYPSF